jgi:ribosome-associated toxin RatA of RatAB toxin-antitoxin module
MSGLHTWARKIGAVGIAIVALGAPGAAGAGDELPAKGQVEVKSYPVDGSSSPKIVVRAVMELPPQKIWQIVSDCSTYKDHLPRVAASKLLSRDGNKFTCEVTIAMPFPLSNLTAVTEATHEESDKGMSRRWKLLRGDYKVNTGSWEVRPLDGGKSSLVTYTVHAEPNTAVPDWIRESAQKKALPEMIERVRAEAGKV